VGVPAHSRLVPVRFGGRSARRPRRAGPCGGPSPTACRRRSRSPAPACAPVAARWSGVAVRRGTLVPSRLCRTPRR